MIRIVTFNIRSFNYKDGINVFPNRLPYILDRVNATTPDVIGFQEIVERYMQPLTLSMPEYAFIGTGRDPGYRGESCHMAYRKDTLELHAMDQFWLSDTPRVPGSKYPTQGCTRVCVWAKFLHKASGQRFYVLNTHLDHMGDGETVREKQLAIVLAKARELLADEELPLFITGDFNLEPHFSSYKQIAEKGFIDLTADVEPTFHDFGRRDPAVKIDYILTDKPVDATVERWHECHEGIYLSDHDPIMLTWENE